jgi:AcrR family transcriptional regulator
MPGYVRAVERREQLLVAARSILVRDGLDDLTLRAVAAEAGVHLSTLQYIFHSRAELVDALVERVLADARYGQFEPGDGGLQQELTRQLDWFAGQFLADPAMLELFRHELRATLSRRDPADPLDLPLQRNLMPVDDAARIAGIGERAGEAYQRSTEDLGQLWGLGLTGLFLEFLTHRDPTRLRRNSTLLVDAMVSTAQPVRRATP